MTDAGTFRAVYWTSADGRHRIRLTEFWHARLAPSELLEEAETEAAAAGIDPAAGSVTIEAWTHALEDVAERRRGRLAPSSL